MTVSLDSEILEWPREQAESESASVSQVFARLLEREQAEASHGRS
jgi:hypothetical protein